MKKKKRRKDPQDIDLFAILEILKQLKRVRTVALFTKQQDTPDKAGPQSTELNRVNCNSWEYIKAKFHWKMVININ